MKTTEQTNKEFFKRFREGNINEYPKTITAYINNNGKKTFIEVPTKEVFENGNWLARKMAGLKFNKLENYLWKTGSLAGLYGQTTIGFK